MTRPLHTTPILLIALIAMLASVPPAFAQQRTFEGRGFIVVNGGYQMTRNDFEEASTFALTPRMEASPRTTRSKAVTRST